jgi:hypothetical protein
MVTIIDVTSEMAKLTMLRGRTPTTPPAARAGSSARLADYRDGGIFASKFADAATGSATRRARRSCRSSMAARFCTS